MILSSEGRETMSDLETISAAHEFRPTVRKILELISQPHTIFLINSDTHFYSDFSDF